MWRCCVAAPVFLSHASLTLLFCPALSLFFYLMTCRPLPGSCTHACLLLCHPGPCPPCPLLVDASCFCGKAVMKQRCGNNEFSCRCVLLLGWGLVGLGCWGLVSSVRRQGLVFAVVVVEAAGKCVFSCQSCQSQSTNSRPASFLCLPHHHHQQTR